VLRGTAVIGGVGLLVGLGGAVVLARGGIAVPSAVSRYSMLLRDIAGINPEGMASPGRRAPFREFTLAVAIDFSGALKVA
jgi:hypothetical protein